jgi:hypothetical protein
MTMDNAQKHYIFTLNIVTIVFFRGLKFNLIIQIFDYSDQFCN